MKRPGKNVVALVVDRLPPPDKLKSGGGRSASYDTGSGSSKDDKAGDDSSIGYESAVQDFAKALGIGKVEDMEGAIQALKDFVEMCKHDEDQEEANEDEQ